MPRETHYQVSLTSKQALGLFLVLLSALAGAYFLGLLTGLPRGEPAARIQGAEVREQDTFPTPVLGLQSGEAPREDARPLRRAENAPQTEEAQKPEPAARGSVVLFEDRAEGESAVPGPEGRARSSQPAPAGGFWIQTVSLTSEGEAHARAARLAARGYKAVVLPASTPEKRRVFRVRVGPYETREEAARAAARLSTEEKSETWIVPAEP